MDNTQNLGVLADTRADSAKEFDYKHEELFASSVPTYLPNPAAASTYVGRFPVDDQHGTSSCVAHGKVLVMSIFNFLQGITKGSFVQLASMFVYRNRVNFPQEGRTIGVHKRAFSRYTALTAAHLLKSNLGSATLLSNSAKPFTSK